MKYRKIPIISPSLIFVQKACLMGLFSEGLFIGRNFAFQNRLGLTIKQPKTLRNQPKTASTNSAWAYIWGAYFREGLFIYFF